MKWKRFIFSVHMIVLAHVNAFVCDVLLESVDPGCDGCGCAFGRAEEACPTLQRKISFKKDNKDFIIK